MYTRMCMRRAAAGEAWVDAVYVHMCIYATCTSRLTTCVRPAAGEAWVDEGALEVVSDTVIYGISDPGLVGFPLVVYRY